ncbi:MAG TPA: LPS export ABC transporter periplasmic protein LptC [Thermodesulfobacteriota bacterium]|nr:LPS export ABC transporter periplasmic protein LptC [Thermodesulfobacteriota bacterium]
MKFILKKITLTKTKLFLAGIGVASFLGIILVLTLTLSEKETPTPLPVPENPQGADIIINNFEYTSTNAQGVTEWKIKSDTASYFQDNKMIGFKKVNATFYAKGGRIFTVRSDKGTLNTEAKDFELSGNVVGTSSDGYTFRTETLTYTADKNQARTNKKVYLESPQFKLEGTGMVLDVKEQKLFLINRVTAQVTKAK